MASPRVLAVLVVTDGEPWLAHVLRGLESQTYPALDVVAVDNGSTDRSRELLLSRLSEDRVLVAERDIGFGGAVAMAADAVPGADYLLFVHDDMVLIPDAVEHLVDALLADPRLGVVGPKLLDWDHPNRLQSVGWSVDLTGRSDSGLEPDERDQGQRDARRRPLVVSTAGMLVRRDVFDTVGRFDRRYHAFRDDLDLCWRVWLCGWEVEVVPEARVRHKRAASGYHRLGQTGVLGPRYFAERNTLATLLKNYGAARLALVLPVFLVMGLLKATGFVATRRVGDAWQTIRAWAWNLLHLGQTLRLRRQVQAMRRRPDSVIVDRLARITPRARAYVEAIADRLTGGGYEPPRTASASDEAEPASATARVIELARRRPVAVAAVVLFIVGTIVALPLLESGPLRGGDLAPFPASSAVALEDYLASWHDVGAFGTGAAPSPAQALLGLLQFVSLGSAYVASRLVVLGALPLAWLLALRACRPLSLARGPRLAAATIYVLSPTAIAAVRTGRVGALAVVVTLPVVAAALAESVMRSLEEAARWRAAAAAVLASGIMVAFEPATAPAVALAIAVLAVVVATRSGDPLERRRTLMRLGTITVAILAVLFPWSLTLFSFNGPVSGGAARVGADAAPLWRWLLQAPDAPGFAGVLAGVGALAAGLFGILFAAPRRRLVALGLWGVALGGVLLATLTSRAGAEAWTWPGVPLLLATAAWSALLAVGLRSVAGQLAEHDFGWRQVSAAGVALVSLLGIAVSLVSVTQDGWSNYVVDEPPLPAFVTARGQADAADYRVLLLADRDGVVSWDMTGAGGPTMADYGTTEPTGFVDTVTGSITSIMGGSDPGAGGRLGLFNVRYVVVPEQGRSERLERNLAAQLDLEPRPVAEGMVFEVTSFLPRVAWVSDSAVEAIDERGTPPTDLDLVPLPSAGGTTFRGDVPGGGAVLVSEAEVSAWTARVGDAADLDARASGGLVRFDLGPDDMKVVVSHGHQAARTLAVAAQILAVLLVISLVLRAPSAPTAVPEEH